MKKLIMLRKQRKLTQQEMAQYLGITRQAYQRYENGSREPDIATLYKIADFFAVTLDDLLEREQAELQSLNPSTNSKPEYQRIFESQSPQRQEILLKMLEVLAGMTDTQLENTKGFFSVACNYKEAKKKKPESL